MRNNEIPKPIIKGTRHATGIPPHNNIAWLKKHHKEYQGEWVALHDSKLLAASEDGFELYKTIKNACWAIGFGCVYKLEHGYVIVMKQLFYKHLEAQLDFSFLG